MNREPMDLGQRLREVRRRRTLSLYEVGERTGRHFSTIAKYERGERRPDIGVLRELAAVYDVPLIELLGDEPVTATVTSPEATAPARVATERQDLRSLVDVCQQLRPDQVLGLVGFLRTVVPEKTREQPAQDIDFHNSNDFPLEANEEPR